MSCIKQGGGRVNRKVMFNDKGGRGGLGKSDFCDEGEGGVQNSPNWHDVIKGQPLMIKRGCIRMFAFLLQFFVESTTWCEISQIFNFHMMNKLIASWIMVYMLMSTERPIQKLSNHVYHFRGLQTNKIEIRPIDALLEILEFTTFSIYLVFHFE